VIPAFIKRFYRAFSRHDSTRLWTILVFAFLVRFITILPHGNDIAVPFRDQNTYYSLARSIVDDGYLGVPTAPRGPYVEYRMDKPRPDDFYPAFHDSMAAVWDEQGYLYGMVEWGKPNSFFEPLYPLVSAGLYILFGDRFFFWRLLHVLMGTITVFFIYDMARRAFPDWRIATLAALYASIYPHFVFYSWILMAEPLLFLTLVGGMWAYIRLIKTPGILWAILLGGFFAGFTLTRSFLIAFFPFMLLFVVLFVKDKRRWQFAGLSALIFCAMMAPWIVRNSLLHDQFVLLSTRGGYNIWMRNNPYYIEDELRAMGVEFSPELLDNLNYKEYILGYPDFTPKQGELERNEILTREGLKFIKANPDFFLDLCWLRFKWTIGYKGIGLQGLLLNGISLLSYGPVLLGFLLSLFLGWRYIAIMFPFWSVVGYFILFYSLTHEGLRYRVPVDSFMIILMAFSAIFIIGKFQRRNHLTAKKLHAG
jgi:4-amino-4-deoxy-L-arabinose transferase-like glycosyltransferase